MTVAGQARPASTPLGRRAFIQGAVASVPLVAGASRVLADNEVVEKFVADKIAAGWVEPEVTQRAFMDISIGGKPAGRLVIAVSEGFCWVNHPFFELYGFFGYCGGGCVCTRTSAPCVRAKCGRVSLFRRALLDGESIIIVD